MSKAKGQVTAAQRDGGNLTFTVRRDGTLRSTGVKTVGSGSAKRKS